MQIDSSIIINVQSIFEMFFSIQIGFNGFFHWNIALDCIVIIFLEKNYENEILLWETMHE